MSRPAGGIHPPLRSVPGVVIPGAPEGLAAFRWSNWMVGGLSGRGSATRCCVRLAICTGSGWAIGWGVMKGSWCGSMLIRSSAHERLYIAGGWQERSRFLVLGKGAHGEVRDDDESVVERVSDGPAGL
jgi:hypothetical protein